jgi:hypothetical protein
MVVLVVCVCVSSFLFLSRAQQQATGFEVSDLQLISTASRPDWTDRWTAPVEAATIMAWFEQHGYPALLPDLNGDRVTNELDTIELADRFGKTTMETGTARGTTDALLVYGLAKYVADKYPDEFELKIYDAGFPAEFQRDLHIPFRPDAIPGITLTLKPEPNYAAYQSELRDEEGVIVGIEQAIDRNYYLAGRSFLFAPTNQGNYAIDLAWAEDDPWQAGVQGQVLRTLAQETDAFYVNYQGAWIKVECMLALSPKLVGLPVVTTAPQSCSCLSIVFDGKCTCSGYLAVQSCSISGTVVITNHCSAVQTGPFSVNVSTNPPCGNQTVLVSGPLPPAPGSISVPYWFPCNVPQCSCSGGGFNLTVTFDPGIPGCPVVVSAPRYVCCQPQGCDVAIEFSEQCTCSPVAGCTIAGFVVILNNSSTSVTTPFWIYLTTTPPVGVHSVHVTTPIPVAPGSITVPYSFLCNDPTQCACPPFGGGCNLTATLDFDMPGCPDVVGIKHICCPYYPYGEKCPDVTMDVNGDCACDPDGCTISGTVVIMNHGSANVTPPVSIMVGTSPDVGSQTVNVTSPIPANGYLNVPYHFTCTNCLCTGGEVSLTATLDFGIPGCPVVSMTQSVCCIIPRQPPREEEPPVPGPPHD